MNRLGIEVPQDGMQAAPRAPVAGGVVDEQHAHAAAGFAGEADGQVIASGEGGCAAAAHRGRFGTL